jgi:ABC-type multidrug transport system permease subunit
MAPIIASIVFLAGIAIAVLSALVVAEQSKNKWWYAIPSVYSLLVNVAYEKIYNHGFDVSAIVFFAAALTLIGWGVVRFELRRDRDLPK